MKDSNNSSSEKIAVIGIGCRFPGGANNYTEFWQNILEGKDCLVDTPANRYNAESLYSKDKAKPGKLTGGRGGYIDGFDEFDPAFFGIGPREAEYMDPQQRKLLEVSWEALEDAGQLPHSLAGKNVGVFIGGFTLDYKIVQFADLSFKGLAAHTATGTMMTILSNRISYCFDFNGPSMSVDTACSSSLVSVHLACQSLASGESSVALAGGVLLHMTPQYTITESKGGFLSPEGLSRTYDADANGYVRSEGVGVVALKRLDDALRDGDPIHSVILASGVNQDGRTKGITVPSGEAQASLIRKVCKQADVNSGELQYIEAHGTSTPVGDPIEANALGKILEEGRESGAKCYISSVKANIGHTEAAAGVAGLIKTTMALKHKIIPPHINLKTVNPALNIDEQPFEIPRVATPWPEHKGPARAGVNSFGFGGTNAHVILEEAPAQAFPSKRANPNYAILPLTARDPADFPTMVANMRDAIISNQENPRFLHDAGFTLSQKRQQLEHSLAFVYKNKDELLQHMDNFIANQANPNIVAGTALDTSDKKLVWVFTGMGPQWWGMGKQLFEQEPVYRKVIEACDKEMRKHADWSLIEELNKSEDESNMADTWLAQPANFALQIALAAMWRAQGIEPDAIVGHSAGEAAAFYEAGVYSLEDAVAVIIHRSRLQHKLNNTGGMLAVSLTEQDALARIKAYGNKVSIAAINSPTAMTLAGDVDALQEVEQSLKQAEIFCKFLAVNVPYHSAKMDVIKDELFKELATIRPKQTKLPLYLTGRNAKAEGPELDAAYWWDNVRYSVRFKDAIDNIAKDGFSLFLEIGPHPVLTHSVLECLAARQITGNIVPSIRRLEDEPARFMQSLAMLHNLGLKINWQPQYGGGVITTLPTYPWKKDRYWAESKSVAQVRLGHSAHPLLGRRLASASPAWETLLDIEQQPYLSDHRIQGNVLFPAAGYVEMAAQAMKDLTGDTAAVIADINLLKALYLPEADTKAVQFNFDADSARFTVTTMPNGEQDPVIHASGCLRTSQTQRTLNTLDLKAIQARSSSALNTEKCYASLTSMGYHYGPAFQPIENVWIGKNEALARIVPSELLGENANNHHFHPALMDACFQVLLTTEIPLAQQQGEQTGIRLPLTIKEIRTQNVGSQSIWAHAQITQRTADEVIGNITIYDDHNKPLGVIQGFRAANVETVSSQVGLATIDSWLTEVNWIDAPVKAKEDTTTEGCTLVFGDAQSPLVAAVVKTFKLRNQPYCVVSAGEQFNFQPELNKATVQANNQTDLETLISTIEANTKCEAILYLWQLDAPQLENCELEQLDASHSYNTYPLITLAKALSAIKNNARLIVATRSAQAVSTTDIPQPLPAAAWGAGRVLWFQELVDNRGKLVDLDQHHADSDTHTAQIEADQLLHELISQDEAEVAWRNNQRFCARLQPATNLSRPLPLRLRTDGCYLVTGALGALGRLVCQTLVKRGARRIILMGRTAIPPRKEWHKVDPTSAIASHIEFIQQLEANGAEAILAPVDVTNEQSISSWLADFKEQGRSPIRGVFHLAGQVRDTLIAEMQPETYNAAYNPKVLGSYLLHRHLASEPLDHFVMFASVASLLTTAGQTNYAAGNAFLDVLAHHRRAQGLPGLAIDWGPWATGMIEELGLIDHYRNSRGMSSLSPEAGMDVLERVMGQNHAQLMVNTVIDWPLFTAWYPTLPPLIVDLAAQQKEAQGETDQGAFIDRFKQADESQRIALLSEHFTHVVSDVLRIKTELVAAESSLNDLGLDSLLAIELRARIQRDMKVALPVVTLLSGTVVSELINKINTNLLEQISNDTGVTATENKVVEYTNENEFPLSQNQTALWFLKHLNPDGYAYNIGGAVEVRTDLQPELMFEAVRELIRRHPLLRANFAQKNGQAMQFISPEPLEDIALVDVEGREWNDIYNMIIEDYRKPYDLAYDSLMRFRLYRRGDNQWVIMKAVHHIISDAISTFTFIDELLALYESKRRNDPITLPPLKARYLDFCNWQNRFLASAEAQRMQDYWLAHLPEEIPVLNLPLDKPRPPVQTNNGASQFFTLDKHLTARVQEFANQQGMTVFMVLISAYYALLNRYSGQENIIVGSPVLGRTEPEFAQLYGYFVNPLPLHADLSGEPSTIKLLEQVQQTVLNGLDNQEYPFVNLVDKLGLQHDPSRSAVFQAMFILLAHKVSTEQYGYKLDYIELPEEEGQFDLTLSVYEDMADGRFHCVFKYNTDLFFPETMERLTQHYQSLLTAMLESPEKPISKLEMLSDAEKTYLLDIWSGKTQKITENKTIIDLIDSHSASGKDAVVLPNEMGKARKATYAELTAKSNRLAHNLQNMGIGKGSIVALCLPKSPELIITLLGVLKAGAAYLPLDPDYPADRISYMLNHAKVNLALVDNHTQSRLSEWQGKALTLADKSLSTITKTSRLAAASHDDLAYVIYTSGSTGKPKAVQVTHGNLAAIYQGWEQHYKLRTEVSVFAQMASFSFDVFAGDLVRALCSGGKLVLIERDVLFNTANLYETFINEKVDCVEFVPAVVRGLMNYCESQNKRLDFIKLLIVGSDVWTVEEMRRLRALCQTGKGNNNRVVNSYGLSEATIDSTYFEGDLDKYENGKVVPIGRPFSNCEVYILDAYQQPTPIGVPGELWIGGEAVTNGYFAAPELTAQRFVTLELNNRATRLYRTGDLAQWDTYGTLHLLGRADNQVKVRGHRIEVGEIEAQLKTHSNVAQAVITLHKDSRQEAQLCAYCVPRKGSLDIKDLRQHLGSILPTYMIPARFMVIDELPLSPNGKVDLKALPEPSIDKSQEIIEPPVTLYEVRMAEHWKALLGLEQVGLQQDFFEVGGSSVKLIELIYHLQTEFNIALSVSQLFKISTLYGMAKTLENIIIGRESGAQPYLMFNQHNSASERNIFCFPPAGGHGLVYRNLAQQMQDHTLISFNYLTGDDKVERYANLITQQQPQGPYTLFGYSLGGNLAFEIAKLLEARGHVVVNVVIMDSYRTAKEFDFGEQHLAEFEKELSEHLRKHVGSEIVAAETLEQARDYIGFSSRTPNIGTVNAAITVISDEDKLVFYASGEEGSWHGCATQVTVLKGAGKHADMLDEQYVEKNAQLALSVLEGSEEYVA
ncbi:hybrid non-ribosomal peptide synthetase/type I polyketide synthase [Saccharophagus degradans]|uniref:Amino acid adenylation domain-containing protein n=2 Tax=Gammaproteobacteria TaxID=1236 RepID=A0AAW7X8G8_9GAMM|nr:hybrid non-ribosomal peptide synthetase/type I polyketide synthase [Saccharophagus degradans]MDO6423884.1 amino acid adenylation domain-containing protein [Saccharophagus degradans]MDO6607961.1 amino acid adenylation domain-containing protein [Saccharophagus degradans]